MTDLLSRIDSPADLKSLTVDQLKDVAVELRHAIIENLSKTGGHFASNLGATDLILALHTVYEVPKDKVIWDVVQADLPLLKVAIKAIAVNVKR